MTQTLQKWWLMEHYVIVLLYCSILLLQKSFKNSMFSSRSLSQPYCKLPKFAFGTKNEEPPLVRSLNYKLAFSYDGVLNYYRLWNKGGRILGPPIEIIMVIWKIHQFLIKPYHRRQISLGVCGNKQLLGMKKRKFHFKYL